MAAAENSLASRLYRGEAGLNIVGRRKMWFAVAAVLVLIALGSLLIKGFNPGIEFAGGNSFQIPTSVGTMDTAESTANDVLGAEGARVVTTQQVGGGGGEFYELRTTELDPAQAEAARLAMGERFGIDPAQISANRVSEAWGSQVTNRALLGLVIFLAVVTTYLVFRFEWQMAVAALFALVMNLVLTAGIYSIVGFEVTPSTIIGFLTILGFALYDVVVVFDKVQENTKGITANNNQTYGEAANLAVNQSLMRSLNTSVVALLPVGGILFIGAGLLGAGTLKDLGLVLFVGMAMAFLTSILLATPLLVVLKNQDPRIQAHNKRVETRRGAISRGEVPAGKSGKTAPSPAEPEDEEHDEPEPAEGAALAGAAAPKVGSRPAGKRSGGARGGRPRGAGGNRPGGGKRR
ncbi:protein translocase subunit SecF [Micromonospora endophytica]|uniref:Protein-export membrane protein SecF n=1 Tax=Micromonospora endophytica TaxID=515350 RepID=A0A2W2CZX9_9ACTN|nr:protein translocase subunit SecF [Micromonospora endophytica]PZF93959.1 protein translocase subunit SecF [Micromonospora endophytica]RIW49802.1 protein translocase subunit SecF [Micromonospora endophytica]BCJ57282.1 protein-export membrane protein SecF [Micromonospora endophytica]